MTAPTLEAERAAPELLPCPECKNEYLAIRTDIYKDKREFAYCDCCGCIAVRSVWNAIARTADPVAEGVALPSLPNALCRDDTEHDAGYYTAEQVRQVQRDAVVADRRARSMVPSQMRVPGQSIDTPEFRALLDIYRDADSSQSKSARAALIAYIDGRTAGTVPADPFAGQRFLNWNRSQEKPPVAIGKELGVARKVLELAAAPSPLPPKEEA